MKGPLSTFNFKDFQNVFGGDRYLVTDMIQYTSNVFIENYKIIDCEDNKKIVLKDITQSDAHLVAKRMNSDDVFYLKEVFEYCKYD